LLTPDQRRSETVCRLLRSEWRRAFQRGRPDKSGTGAITGCHAPCTVAGRVAPRSKVVAVKPIDLLAPPAHLEHRFGHHGRMLERLAHKNKRRSR
jgi:hypothetical protein